VSDIGSVSKFLMPKKVEEIEDHEIIPIDPSKVFAPDLINIDEYISEDYLGIRSGAKITRPSDKIVSLL
jgi:hypothetical protein